VAEVFGGHLVARYLKEVEEVDTVFSLSGGHIDRIYDGFLNHEVRLIDVRHEQAAAMMAHAWTIYRGRPGVCIVTAGPGFTNALTGIVNAYQENAPVVFISGISPIREASLGALQEINQLDMVKATVKWYDRCQDIKRIPEYLNKAFRQAITGRPGPVYLEIPPDVLDVKVDEASVQFPDRCCSVYRSAPDPESVAEAARLLNSAERPVILGGSGIAHSGCTDQIRELVDKSGMPFMLINGGRGAVPDDHPGSLWDGGLMGLMTAGGQADVVLALGIRFSWLLMYGALFPSAKIVKVDIDPTEIDRNKAADVGLVGDLRLALQALNPVLEKRDHSAWRKSLQDAYLPAIQSELEQRKQPSDPIHPTRMVELVRQVAGDDAIYIVDGGDTSYYGAVGLNATEMASVYMSAGGQFGCLGTGVPFAMAAKAARPEKTVVAINGDGSFGLNAMEFDTAVRHKLPFVCVVNNDRAWGMIKHAQEMCYGNDRVIGSELGLVHYEKMVEALGGHGELVEKDADLVPAMERALKSGKPACVNVLTDPCVVSPLTVQFVSGLDMGA
jgi:acetolactate synthase-1/2/3 large subunit